jgi:hypothetical protein
MSQQGEPPVKRNPRSELTHYDLLGVSPAATATELQKRYRRLALEHHPDRNVGREEEVKATFQRITEAYTVLMDPARREAYDSRRNVNFSSRVATMANRAAKQSEHQQRRDAPSASPSRDPPQPGPAEDASDDDYAPGYSASPVPSVGTAAAEPIWVDPNTEQRTVSFRLERSEAAAPLGFKLPKDGLAVRGAVEGTAAADSAVPTGSVIVSADGEAVNTPQELGGACTGKTHVTVDATCNVRRVRISRALVSADPALTPLLDAGPRAEPLASETTAVVTLRSREPSTRLCPGDAQRALTLADLGGVWARIGGKRVVAVEGHPVPSACRVAAVEAEPADAHLPSGIARRRRLLELLVLQD